MMQTQVLQTETPSTGAAADPAARGSLLAPPGIRVPDAAEGGGRGTAGARAERVLGELRSSPGREEVVDVLREAILSEAEARVALRVEELWTRAQKVVNQLQEKHNEETSKLLEEVTRCRERQQALQAENDALRESLRDLSERLSLFGGVPGGSGKEDLTAAPVGAFPECRASPTTSPAQASPDFATPGPFLSPGGEASFQSPAAIAGLDCLWDASKLPELPAFPFPAQPPPAKPLPPPGTPLSLADALGADVPKQSAPCSLPESVPPPPPGVAPLLSRDFGFMLPEAGASPEPASGASGAWPGSAAEAWSHPWASSSLAEQAGPPSRSTTLRADACVFVPWGAGPPAQASRRREDGEAKGRVDFQC